MFHSSKSEPIEFRSNPPFTEESRIVPDRDDHGVIINKVVLVPKENKSALDGVHFSREEMSLRAKLNLGIPLSRVPNPGIENDPARLNAMALHFVDDFESRLSQLQKVDALSANT